MSSFFESIFGSIVFIIVVVVAVASKIQESRRAKSDHANPTARRSGMPGGDEPVAPGRQLMEALLGRESDEDDEWEPVHPPRPRRELAPQPQQRPRAQTPEAKPGPQQPRPRTQQTQSAQPQQGQAQQDPSRQTATPAQTQPSAKPTPRQAPQKPPPQPPASERQRREQLEARKRTHAAQLQKRKAQAARARAAGRPAARRKRRSLLFGSMADARSAVLFAEIIGPPKGLVNDRERFE